ncbi:MAG: 2-dehydropantoate 2-reductase [Planctomycetaceae bacterium]|nr:2-dehydropantoate 2-reductase [Planctomycetaceae bacterium]
MKVTVLGAGAIGSMFGGLIKHHAAEIDVLLIGRGDHGRAIHDSGEVVLEGPWPARRVAIRCTEDVAQLAGSDVVLLTVKSQATEAAIRAAAPYLGQAALVSIQNGINGPKLLEFVAADRLVLGMTATNMAILKPGNVSLQLDGATLLGTPPGQQAGASLDQAVTVLRKSGLQVRAHSNIVGAQYNKLAINALGYASCLSASRFILEAVLHPPWRRALAVPLLDECAAVFQAAGVSLEKAPGAPGLHSFRRLLKWLERPLVGPLLDRFGRRVLARRKPIVFSLYQDLLRSKPTEIDSINGEIVRMARQQGRDAPYNALVVDLVHQLQQRGDGTFFSREFVIEQFSSLAANKSGQPAV